MTNMNKNELEKRLERNGWKQVVEKNLRSIGYTLYLCSETSVINFKLKEENFAYMVYIYGTGRKKIKKEDFFCVIDFLKEQRMDKPFLIHVLKKVSTDAWINKLESHLKIENFHYTNKLIEKVYQFIFISSFPKETYYQKEDEIQIIENYVSYVPEIEKVAKKHEKKTFFFYSNEKEYVDKVDNFFFSIEDHHCFVSLKIKNKSLKLCIKKTEKDEEILKEWNIDKKEDIENYLEEYIKQTEKKQRIRTMYQVSTHFFEHFCVVNEIYEWENARDELLRYYTIKQLEEISINICKSKNKTKKLENSREELTFFDDKAIHFSYNTGKLKVIANQEEINQHIKEMEKDIS